MVYLPAEDLHAHAGIREKRWRRARNVKRDYASPSSRSFLCFFSRVFYRSRIATTRSISRVRPTKPIPAILRDISRPARRLRAVNRSTCCNGAPLSARSRLRRRRQVVHRNPQRKLRDTRVKSQSAHNIKPATRFYRALIETRGAITIKSRICESVDSANDVPGYRVIY